MTARRGGIGTRLMRAYARGIRSVHGGTCGLGLGNIMRRLSVLVTSIALCFATVSGAGTAVAAPAQTVAGGAYHSLWIANDGVLWGSGYNFDGELGDGTYTGRSAPVAVGYFSNWWQCDAGQATSYGLRSDGSLWSWGSNQYGQLGVGTLVTKKVARPVRVSSPATFTAMSAGGFHALAIKSDGSLWAWGLNDRGQLGVGDRKNRPSPTRVGSANDWVAVAASTVWSHSAAQKADGSWWIWGFNANGQLGQVDLIDRLAPVQVANPGVADMLYLGSYHTIARWAPGNPLAGRLTSVGRNSFGALGRSTGVIDSTPYFGAVDGGFAYTDVSAGHHHNVALLPSGSLMAWGWGGNGELGMGSFPGAVFSPATVAGIDNVTAVAAGADFSLAKRADSTIWGWGNAAQGQLGRAGTTKVASPSRIASLTTAYLSTPGAPVTVLYGQTVSLSGYMLPSHAGPIRVAIYRGTTKVKTITARVTPTSSGAKWVASFRPTARGYWYFQATHTDAVHQPSASAKRRVTVK